MTHWYGAGAHDAARVALDTGQRRLDDELLLCVRAMNAVDRAVADGRRAAGGQAGHLDRDQLIELLREP